MPYHTPDHLARTIIPLEYRTEAADAALHYANTLVQSALAAYNHAKLNTQANRDAQEPKLAFAGQAFIDAYMAEKDALDALNKQTSRIATVLIREFSK